MQERLARAGYRADVFRVVRNPSTPYSDTRIRAEENQGIVFVGRLEQDKGALDVAGAAARAGMTLTMVGDGVLRETLERSIPISASPDGNRAKLLADLSELRGFW